MPEFVALPSRWRIALLLLGAAAFVVVGLWMAGVFGAAPESRRYPHEMTVAIGWVCAGFFGLCGAAVTLRLFETRAQVRIGARGIHVARWSDETMPWSEIARVSEWSFRGQRSIILHLRDPKRFPGRGLSARLAAANRVLTGGDIAISLTGTDRSVDEALAAIARFRR